MVGINEDFPHIANTIKKLIQENKISPIILVGIENTQRRRDLTGFTTNNQDKKIAPVVGGAQNFRAFIKEELFATIQKKFNTTNTKSIIGESLAGLFIIETFLSDPNMFDNYITFDPSLWWNNHFLVTNANAILANNTFTNKRVFIAASNTKDIKHYTKKLANIFQSINPRNLQCKYVYAPTQTHATIFKATKEEAIIWCLQ